MNIEVKKMSKWYGQVIGVNQLDFTIKPGVTGLLGPNGAGKSTFLKILSGQLLPSKGSVSIDGMTLRSHPELADHLGYCPEYDAFWPMLTGREFLVNLLRLHQVPLDECLNRAQQAMDIVDMVKHADKKIGGYSKGMRQRIKLAQAIAHGPDVILLDEPLNGMDPVGRQATIELIREFGKQGKTVLISSHILHEVEEMTDTILLINHGRQLAYGNIYEIRDLIDTHPLQVSIRCPEINVLTAKLLEYEDVLSVQFDREKHLVTVETNRPRDFHARLPELVLTENIHIESLWSPDEHLEAVFDYLVR